MPLQTYEEMLREKQERGITDTTPSLPVQQRPVYNRRIDDISIADINTDPYVNQRASWTISGAAVGVGRVLGRTAIRPVEDIYNAANEIFQFGEKAEWDEALFGDPVNNAEEFASEVGSFLVTFLLPGGAIAKGVTAGAKAAGVTAKTAKITATLSKTEKGRKILKYTAIGAEGSIAGAVADYLSSDTGDETGLEAIQHRLMDTMRGAVIGAGLNIGGHFLKRYVGNKIQILRARKGLAKAIEKGADPTRELDKLGKALKKEEELKGDVFGEVVTMNTIVDDIDIDALPKPKARVVETPEGKPAEAPQGDGLLPKPNGPETVEEQIFRAQEELQWFLSNGQTLADQLNSLVALTKDWNKKFEPMFAGLMKQFELLGKNLPDAQQEEAIKKTLQGMEVRLEQHKLLMKYRAIAGNYAGKNLRAFHGDGADFSKPFQYKDGTRKRIEAIDDLLDLIKATRKGENVNQEFIDALKIKVNTIDQVAQTGRLDRGIRKTIEDTQEQAAKTIWGRYKEEIGNAVVKHLTPSKEGQKALLDVFTNDVTKALKAIPEIPKKEKVVRNALEEIESLIENPEKIKESIEGAIKAIQKSDLAGEIKDKAITELQTVLDGQIGKRIFELLPSTQKQIKELINQQLDKLGVKVRRAVAEGNEVELLENVVASIKRQTGLPLEKQAILEQLVREQLGAAIADIRDKTIREFITSELYQKFMLSGEIAELEDMAGKPINEIKDYLISIAKQRKQTPEDIKLLRKQRDAAKAELEKAVEKEYFVELLKRLSKIQEYQTPVRGQWELGMQLVEQWRYNVGMLQSFKTYFVGPVSAIIQLGVQPIKQSLKTALKTSYQKRAGLLGKDVSSFRIAVTELTSTYEYFSNWADMWQLFVNTFKNGGFSVFNPKSIQRHAEYVTNAVEKGDPTQLAFKDRRMLKEMIRLYVEDTPDTRSKVRKFFEDISDGTPEGGLGKAMEMMFSLSQRVMGALDDPVSLLGTRRALRAKLAQEGILQGLDGDALAKYIQEGFEQNISKEGGYPMWRGAEEMSDIEQLGLAISFRADYTEQFISQTARSFANWSRRGDDVYTNPMKILARWSIPFIKTPTAILQYTVDNFPPLAALRSVKHWMGVSPLHKAKKLTQEKIEDAINIKKNAVTKQERELAEDAIVKQKELLDGIEDKLLEAGAEINSTLIMSSSLGIGLFTLAKFGNITGSGSYLPEDMRENMKRNGYKFNQVRLNIGGKEVNVDHTRLEPFSAYLSAYADYAAVSSIATQYPELKEELNDFGTMMQAYMVEQLGNKYFVKGLFEMIRPLVDEDFDYSMSLTTYVESLSPRALREINLVNQEFEKQYIDWKDKMYHRITGLSTGTFMRNALGEKASRQWTKEGWMNFFNPITIQEAQDDPILQELSQSWGKIGYIYEYKKEGVQTRDFRSETGETLYNAWMDSIDHEKQREQLGKLFKSKNYENAPIISDDLNTPTKSDLINDVIRRYRNKGWEDLKKRKDSGNYYNKDGLSWKDDVGFKEIKPKLPPTLKELGAF